MKKDLLFAKGLRKLGIIQRGFLESFNFRLRTNLNGKSFIIPIIKNIGWTNIFNNEPWMYQLFEKILESKTGVFIDIGANIGQTLLKVKSVYSELTYYGIEPNPVCQFYLKELIRINRFQSSFIIPVGLSERSMLAQLNFYSKNPDDSTASVIEQLRPDSVIEKKEFIYLTSLDELNQRFDPGISIIKIDVEGAEPEVLKGAVSTILKYKPVVIIEVLPAYTSGNLWRIERQNELIAICKSIRYDIFQVVKDEDNNLVSLKKITKFGITSNIREIDFILIPEDFILNW
jgi:FkbM family methyltransferase